jgi:putative molybdopterin biosynthesis protein
MEQVEKPIISQVKIHRQRLGLSQSQLAEMIGIKRQAIYDIEAGRYLPNTGVAIRLARRLGCKVEDLFVEENQGEPHPITLIDDNLSGQRVLGAKVRDKVVTFLLTGRGMLESGLEPADGLLEPDRRHARLFSSDERLEQSILLLGCDPAFSILKAHLSRATSSARLLCRFASSRKALEGLSSGYAHIAGTHFHNTNDQESNVAAARAHLSGIPSTILGFSQIEEGLMVQRGNPMNIRSVADLAQPEIRMANREPGAALRTLLDDHLLHLGIQNTAINGYDREVRSHVEGAQMVAFGLVHAALGLRTIAEAFGLFFVPITEVRCDLVIPLDLMDHPAVRVLLDVLQSKELRQELTSLPGYGASIMGNEIARL